MNDEEQKTFGSSNNPLIKTGRPEKVAEGKHNLLKVTVGGSFRTEVATDKGRKNFDNYIVMLPECEDEYAEAFVRRMFVLFLKDNGKDDCNFEGTISYDVDSIEKVKGTNPCIGKDIKNMTWEELQWLSCYKKIREIPLYKVGGLRNAREIAYEKYEEKVNNKKVIRTPQDLQRYKDEMQSNGRFQEEIDKKVSESFNKIVDPSHPETSYNFSKLKPIIVK